MADEGRRAEHADVEADREAQEETPSVDLRRDGAAALEWAARTSSASASCRCSRRSSRATAARLPASPPEQGEPFSNVLRDLDEMILPGDHALAEPALLRVLREHRVRAGDPRRAARCDAEPGRLPLAYLAGAATELEEVTMTGSHSCWASRAAGTGTSRTRRRRRRSPRSRRLGTPDRTRASSSAPSTRTPLSTRRRGCSTSSCEDRRRTTRSACAPTRST